MRFVAVAATCLLVLAAGSTAAFAGGTTNPCSTRDQSKVFRSWGDTNSYFAMPNGGFEAGAQDWWLSGGARVVWGNESYSVGGWGDTKSLRIPAGATAESRTICVGVGEDSVRLFVKNGRVGAATLRVEATVRNPDTGEVAQTSYDIDGNDAPYGWVPTTRLAFPNLLGRDSGEQELTLRFTAVGSAGTWYVDDVFVDPWKLR
jgi:hypothetical protein